MCHTLTATGPGTLRPPFSRVTPRVSRLLLHSPRSKKRTEIRKTIKKSKAQFDAITAAKDDLNKLEKLVNKKEKVAKKKFAVK